MEELKRKESRGSCVKCQRVFVTLIVVAGREEGGGWRQGEGRVRGAASRSVDTSEVCPVMFQGRERGVVVPRGLADAAD